ncbi:MAG: DUF1365 domain-containing protein [Litorivicinaceae bacterium]
MTSVHFSGRGTLWHHRHRPAAHQFRYPTAMLLVDLDQLDTLFARPWMGINRWGILSFHTRRHLYQSGGLGGDAARACVTELYPTLDVSGSCQLLTNPHCLGIGFNPLSVYYLHDQLGAPSALILEVSNTPWNELYRYVLPADALIAGETVTFEKAFHVSPFNPMTQTYQVRLNWPNAERLTLYLALTDTEDSKPLFEAGLSLQLTPYSGHSARPLFLGIWPQTLVVLAGIYREAFQLWRKRVPYHSHPS